MCSFSVLGLFNACASAAMSDLLEGKELAIASERMRVWVSVGVTLSPIVGGWLGDKKERREERRTTICHEPPHLLHISVLADS